MANRFPSFPLYPDDWLASSARAMMTPAARAAYFDLLCHYWNTDCKGIDPDPKSLRYLAGQPRLPDHDLAIVVRQFKRRKKKLHNLKLQSLYKEKVAYFKASSEAGKRGAQARWGKDGDPNRPPTDSPLAKDDSSFPSPSSTPSPFPSPEEGKRAAEQIAFIYQKAAKGEPLTPFPSAVLEFSKALGRGAALGKLKTEAAKGGDIRAWEIVRNVIGNGKAKSVKDIVLDPKKPVTQS